MPRSLLVRAGPDTLGKLEAAARLRHREAKVLSAGEPLGALYLYGYAVECRLKAAYYRVMGLSTTTHLDDVGPTGKPYRKQAEADIKAAPATVPYVSPAGKAVSAGHNVAGWAWLLEQTRSVPPRVPLDANVARQMNAHALAVFGLWSESLRYRGNRPTPAELRTVQSAAAWFARNAKRLWR